MLLGGRRAPTINICRTLAAAIRVGKDPILIRAGMQFRVIDLLGPVPSSEMGARRAAPIASWISGYLAPFRRPIPAISV